MDFNKLALRRESCRKYLAEKAVSKDDMLSIIETATLAPSACNSQPWKFVLVQGEAARPIPKLLQGGGFNQFADNISTFVLVCETPAKLMSGLQCDQQRYAQMDIGSAYTYLCLAAQDKGISTCIMGYYDEQALKELYHFEGTVRVVVGFGYSPHADARPKTRKPLADVLQVIAP